MLNLPALMRCSVMWEPTEPATPTMAMFLMWDMVVFVLRCCIEKLSLCVLVTDVELLFA